MIIYSYNQITNKAKAVLYLTKLQMENTYNWRTNRETRLIGLHYNPETLEDVELIKEDIEEKVSQLDWFLQDFIDTSKINRDEIKENIRKELELEQQEID
jgi:pantothenate kinase-related protein Tda10